MKEFATQKAKKLSVIINKLRGQGVETLLARGASLSLVIQIVGTAIVFTTQVFLARVMGADNYGAYIYVLTWVNILVLFAKGGWDTLLVRYVASYKAQHDWPALRGILKSSNRIVLLASLTLGVTTSLIVWVLRNQMNANLKHSFWIGCLIVPVLAILSLRQATLRGLKYACLAIIPNNIFRPLILLGSVGFLFFTKKNVSSAVALSINLVAVTTCLLLINYWINNRLPEQIRHTHSQYNTWQWMSDSLPMFFLMGMNFLVNRTDILMIGILLGNVDVGIYEAASRITTSILFGLSAVNNIAAPMIAQLHSSGKHKELQKMVTLSIYGVLAYSVPVTVVIILFGNSLLLLFGSLFTVGYSVLVILSIGQLVNAMSGSVGFLMMMTGHQKEAASIIGISAGFNIVLNAILIPILGMNGAAISTGMTIIICNIWLSYSVHSVLGIKSTLFSYKK